MTPEITVFDSLEAASHEAARCLIVAAREAVICTGRAAIALSGGHTPTRLNELLDDPDPDRARRAMEAMLKMGKIDIDEIERAAA